MCVWSCLFICDDDDVCVCVYGRPQFGRDNEGRVDFNLHGHVCVCHVCMREWMDRRMADQCPPPPTPTTHHPLKAYYVYIASNRWLAMRLEFVGACIVSLAGIFSIVGREHGKSICVRSTNAFHNHS